MVVPIQRGQPVPVYNLNRSEGEQFSYPLLACKPVLDVPVAAVFKDPADSVSVDLNPREKLIDCMVETVEYPALRGVLFLWLKMKKIVRLGGG